MSQTVFTAEFKVAGVLTDVTSATMSDPTAAFGIRRTDTNAVLVAAGTAAAHPSTGVYQYVLTDPGPGIPYEAWFALTYQGAVYNAQRLATSAYAPAAPIITSRITLPQARQLIRLTARNAGDRSFYPDAQVDFALQTAADRVIRECGLLPVISTLSLTNASNAFTLTLQAATMRPDRIINAYVTGPTVQLGSYDALNDDLIRFGSIGAPAFAALQPNTVDLTITSFDDLQNRLVLYSSCKGQPQMIAFDQRSGTGLVFPQPDTTYTMTFVFNDLFTQWPPGYQGNFSTASTYTPGDVVWYANGSQNYMSFGGTGANPTTSSFTPLGSLTLADPATITFNIVDDYLREIITVGAAFYLQYQEPNNKNAEPAKAAFEAMIERFKGLGNLGAKSFQQTARY